MHYQIINNREISVTHLPEIASYVFDVWMIPFQVNDKAAVLWSLIFTPNKDAWISYTSTHRKIFKSFNKTSLKKVSFQVVRLKDFFKQILLQNQP